MKRLSARLFAFLLILALPLSVGCSLSSVPRWIYKNLINPQSETTSTPDNSTTQ